MNASGAVAGLATRRLDERGTQMARVLIADDAAIIRMVIGEMLRRGGHEVAGEAETGEAAVRMYAELDPDLAIIDVNMPGDGLTAATRIRESNAHARLIIVSVLAGSPTRMAKVAELRASYVVKPFDEEELLTAVAEALA
jgi:two-component system chemotaxis response regulator CheY